MFIRHLAIFDYRQPSTSVCANSRENNSICNHFDDDSSQRNILRTHKKHFSKVVSYKWKVSPRVHLVSCWLLAESHDKFGTKDSGEFDLSLMKASAPWANTIIAVDIWEIKLGSNEVSKLTPERYKKSTNWRMTGVLTNSPIHELKVLQNVFKIKNKA